MIPVSIANLFSSCAFLALCTLVQPALAEDMQFQLIPFGDPGTCGRTCAQVIGADGEIRDDTPGKFLEFVAANLEDSRVRSIVFLNSPGGGVDASMRLGRMFRKTGVLAVVARIAPAEAGQGPAVNLPGARCFSACVYALMGAKKRIVPPSSLVGIHRMFFYEDGDAVAARNGQGKRTYGSASFVAKLADYAATMGVSRQLIYAAEKVNPDQIRIVTPSELRRWRLGEESY